MTTSDRLALSRPLDGADVPVLELAAGSRRAEARTVMALVAALRDRGVPVRDVAVVVRDLDAYEEPFRRAALQYGIPPVFWTQLRVTRTRPFALVEAVCDVLGADELDRETLFRPLELRWAPPSGTAPTWPVDPSTVQEARQAVASGERSVEEWAERLAENPDVDDRFAAFAEWAAGCPSPTPEAAASVLGDVVDAYERVGLPVTRERDSSALLETETDARAVLRVRTLVAQQLERKYADRLADGTREQSWGDVAEVCRLVATQRPGRREASNARAVDVLEANDVWLLDVPFVVAAGLIEGEWPRRVESPLPPELQEAVLTGDGDAGTLAPRTAWMEGRDRDQFGDALAAARDALVVTRHTERTDGTELRPSPLLDPIDVESVPETERRALASADRELPESLRAVLDDAEGDADGTGDAGDARDAGTAGETGDASE